MNRGRSGKWLRQRARGRGMWHASLLPWDLPLTGLLRRWH